MIAGGIYPVKIDLQNTGVNAWHTPSVFKLSCQWRKPDNTSEVCVEQVSPENLFPGTHQENVTLNVQPPAHFTPGAYTLSIDMMVGPDFFHNREAGRSWFTLDYAVTIGIPKQIFLPLLLKNFGGDTSPPTLPTTCPTTCKRTPSTNLVAGNFSTGAENFWDFFTYEDKIPKPYEMVKRDSNYRQPGGDLGVAAFVGNDWENKVAIDAHLLQEFDVPSVTANEIAWIFFEYSYCISTDEVSSTTANDNFVVSLRNTDKQGVLGTPISYSNLMTTDPAHNDCNPEDGDIRTTGETGWRRVGPPTGGTNDYNTDPLVDEGQYCIDATDYQGRPALIFFYSQVDNDKPTNFYLDNVNVTSCVTD
jgi:hypothetical protein